MDNMQNLINEIIKSKIFKDKKVFYESYIPPEVIGKNNEMRDILTVLVPMIRDDPTKNIFIYGKTGTGKTVTTKKVFDKLIEFIQENKIKLKIKKFWVNCKHNDTTNKILYQILTQDDIKVPIRGWSNNLYFNKLINKIKENNKSETLNKYIIIFDEIDCVKDMNSLLYEFSRNKYLLNNTSIISISNNPGLKQHINPSTKSTLCEEEIIFKPYNALTLYEILKQRVEIGLHENILLDENIRHIAAIAAQEGDARYALKITLKVCEILEAKKKQKITNEVELAKKSVERDIIAEIIHSLPEHEQITLYAIAGLSEQGSMERRLTGITNGSLFTGKVYDMYHKICLKLKKQTRTMRMISNYLSELELLGLISTQSSGKYIRGSTTLIKLNYPPQYIKKYLPNIKD